MQECIPQSWLFFLSSSSMVFFIALSDTLLLGSIHDGSGWYSTKPPDSLSHAEDLQVPFQCLINQPIVHTTQGQMQANTITAMINWAQPGYSTAAVHDNVPFRRFENGFCRENKNDFNLKFIMSQSFLKYAKRLTLNNTTEVCRVCELSFESNDSSQKPNKSRKTDYDLLYKVCTSMQPTYAVYFAVSFAVWAMLAISTIKMATGEMYFQHNIQNMFGRLPVIYSISFPILVIKIILLSKTFNT